MHIEAKLLRLSIGVEIIDRFLNAFIEMFDAVVAMSDVVAASKSFLFLFFHAISVMRTRARVRTRSQLGRTKIYSSPAEPHELNWPYRSRCSPCEESDLHVAQHQSSVKTAKVSAKFIRELV